LAFRVLANGAVENATGSYGTISDIKFKENIVDATPKLADLMNLKVRNFNLKGETTKQIGFIAQEFEEVFPNMVDISKEKDSEETYKSIKTSVLIPILIKGFQEQQVQIQEQKVQIEELSTEINLLKQK
jgi:2C-methyl-D-erythritol 2,4-cyclodiphosphate synthase